MIRKQFWRPSAKTQLDTIIGPIAWKGGPNNPVKNVCKTPLVGGQWTKTDKGLELIITNNPQHPENSGRW